MKKQFIYILLILLSFFSCSEDNDSDNENPPNLSEYIEPNLNFGITKNQFIEEEGNPDDNDIDTVFEYTSNTVGMINYEYIFYPDFLDNDTLKYRSSYAYIVENQFNFNFIYSWLTNKYGDPDQLIEPIEGTRNSYFWGPSMQNSFTVQFVFPKGEYNPNDNSGLSDLRIIYQGNN